jgi:phosphoketolase
MKSFNEYLTESKKTYEFKIKIAGDIDEELKTKLKGAMERFSVVKMDNGKRLPIAERHLDFPELENTNVTVFSVEVNYPTTTQVLENYVSQVCGCEQNRVRVRTANQDAEHAELKIKEKNSLDDTLLATEELGGESAQDKVGQKHISNFLKDLAADAKSRAHPNAPKEKASEMPESGASISPIGSKTLKGKK